jgi:uncharacterized protein YjlB
MNLVSTDIKLPIYKHKVEHHQSVKPLILNAIKDMGTYSLINKEQSISNTDWHLPDNTHRPYFIHVQPIINQVCREIKQYHGYRIAEVTLINYWFQQYAKGDHHLWHTHDRASFSCVYYVALEGETPKTSFRIGKDEFQIEVKEGEVLTFPSFLEHTSKENKSDFIKTVIPFNLTC